jgi:hypothetical protein
MLKYYLVIDMDINKASINDQKESGQTQIPPKSTVGSDSGSFFSSPSKNQLKRTFILTLIACLVLSALIGIFVLLTSSFDATDGRILLSTLAVGLFSITGLANLRNFESPKKFRKVYATISTFVSLSALVALLLLIWTFSDNPIWQPATILSILAVSMAHISLLLPILSTHKVLKTILLITFLCIAIVAGMLIYAVLQSYGDGLSGEYWRILGVFAVLDVLGTIISPVIVRLIPRKP